MVVHMLLLLLLILLIITDHRRDLRLLHSDELISSVVNLVGKVVVAVESTTSIFKQTVWSARVKLMRLLAACGDRSLAIWVKNRWPGSWPNRCVQVITASKSANIVHRGGPATRIRATAFLGVRRLMLMYLLDLLVVQLLL